MHACVYVCMHVCMAVCVFMFMLNIFNQSHAANLGRQATFDVSNLGRRRHFPGYECAHLLGELQHPGITFKIRFVRLQVYRRRLLKKRLS